MITNTPRPKAKKDLNGGINNSKPANDSANTNDDIQETVSALWQAMTNYLEAIINSFSLDVKLAASSLVVLLITSIIVAALLVGLWFLSMAILFAGLVTLQDSVVVALLVIVLIQFLLLYFCRRLSKRLLANLDFQATRASLPEALNCEETQ